MYGQAQKLTTKRSIFRVASTESTASQVDLSKAYIRAVLPKTLNRIQSIRVVNWVIPWSWYNINANNNVFYFQLGFGYGNLNPNQPAIIPGSFNTVTIPPGNYSGDDLAVALTDAIATLDSSWGLSVFFNANNNTFTFTCSISFRIYFMDNVTNSMAATLGMNKGFDLASTTIAFKAVSPKGSKLLRAQEVLVQSDMVRSLTTRSNSGVNGDDHVLASVSLGGYAFGDLIDSTTAMYNAVDVVSPDMSDIEVWLTNESFEPLDLNGYDFSVTLELTYVVVGQ